MRLILVAAVAVMAFPLDARAFVGGAVVSGLRATVDKAHQKFVEMQWVKQIMLMKQNVDAARRYHREFERLNQGRGFFYNVGDRIFDGMKQIGDEQRARLDYEFINTYATNTEVDKLFNGMNRQIEGSIRRAGDGLLTIGKNRRLGVDVAREAKGLSPKEASNLAARAQGLQLQMLVNIYETQLEQLDLQAKYMALQMKEAERRHAVNLRLRESLKKRLSGADVQELRRVQSRREAF